MINEYFVKSYCKDDISLIENYDKAISDSNQTWHCHHRREITTPKKQLLEIGEYFNRPAEELVFLTPFEHMSLHNKNNKNFFGRHHTEYAKRKIAEGNKGKHHSYETKLKMSESHKNMSEEYKQKLSDSHKGKMFTEEHKQKLSEARKGLLWFNNGIINIKVKECPEGFVRGRINLKKYEKRQ